MTTATDLGQVWVETRYDSGVYLCAVNREGDHGKLTIHLVGTINHLLHSEPVKCDRADTDAWRKRCESVINKPELRVIELR